MGLNELGKLLTRLNDPSVSVEFFQNHLRIKDNDINAVADIDMEDLHVLYEFHSTNGIREESLAWLQCLANDVCNLIDLATQKKEGEE